MKRIKVDWPSIEIEIYEGIEFTARPSDSYNPKETARGLAEFLGILYEQLPFEVVEELRKDPVVQRLRACLTERLQR